MRHFVCFDQVFAPISELIDLARWIKFNPSFITWLVLIVLSGTESTRRINFHPGLARFNPRLTLIGFPGTGARVLTITPWDLPLGIICGDLGAIIRSQPNRSNIVECNFAVRMFDSNQALFKRNQNHLEKHYSVQKLRNEPIIKQSSH